MKFRSFLTALMASTWLGLAGCASGERAAQTQDGAAVGLPGITAYYNQATAAHRRTVRKPVRDTQDRAMRMMAEKCDVMLAQSESWDSDARLVSLAEAKRPPARDAVAGFRASLQDLKHAARQSDRNLVQREYTKLIKSYHQVNDTLGPIE
jgi:hypothetical protein